jgi:Uma2 family endonuclease
VSTIAQPIKTLADLLDRLGGVPLSRIRFRPYPGTATLEDVIEMERKDKLCELVEGVLVEKAAGFTASALAGFLSSILNALIIPRNLGIVTGAAGAMELLPGLVRMPDVAFTSWDRMPGRRCPDAPIPRLAPKLAVEVLRRDNTPGEMAVKRQEYFTAGVELVWEVDLVTRTVTVSTSPSRGTVLTAADTLNGGSVLPGFTLPLQQLFAELDRHS